MVFLRDLLQYIRFHFRRLLGYESLDEMYGKMSCINYIHGVDKPMIFINSVDDPIIPPELLEKIKTVTSKLELTIEHF